MIRHPNLILYLPFSGDFADASKSANPITVTGATLTPGPKGQCGNFDGSDDFLQTSNNLGISGTEDFSFSCWIFRDGHQDYGAPICSLTNELTISTVWANPSTTTFEFWMPPFAEVRTNALANSVWHHVVLSRKSGLWSAYWNGQELGFWMYTTSVASITDNPIIIGSFTNGYHFKGKLDELCIFKGLAVSQSDARRLMMGLAPIERR